MELDPETLKTAEVYQWLIHTILPRPIAWVSTVSPEGCPNLAPFSFFTGVCARPPTLMFCPVNDRFGRPKDTLRNVEATGEFVVNLVSHALAEAMNQTSASLPHGESEFAHFGVTAIPSVTVKPPRVAAAPVAFECRLDRIVRLSEGPVGGNAVFGRIVRLHVADAVLGENGMPTARQLDLIGRLGGSDYVRLSELFQLERPQ